MAGSVGFIGLGAMGGPMALNLAKHGHALVVYDIDPGKCAPLREAGARVADSAKAVAAAAERTVVIVETTAQVRAVVEEIAAGAGRGHLVVCMSTIDPIALRAMAARLAERGIAMVDAPVSGGTERARSGALSIIVGGAAETVAACEDLFRAMGGRRFHVGPLGSGLAMKLVNNMLIQVNVVAVAEALVMGVKAGLDPEMIYQVVKVSTGNSVAFEGAGARMLRRDFAPGGTMDIYYKDQELETAFAKQLGVPLLLANVTQQVYQMARAAGLNKEDGSAVVKVIERLAGVTVGGKG